MCRFDEQKGLDILVNFINNNVFNNINLYLIGDGVLNSSNITLNNNIIPLGWVNNDIIDSYYEIFDAVIVPSRWEGFGLVAIEAMRNKKAVIASRRGALPEIVTDKVTGYLFDLNDLNQLKNLFVNLDKEKLKVLGENGYKKFIEQFSSKKMNKRIIKEYIRLLSSKKEIRIVCC
ncbi:glycosyltransferase family 4 protein [Terrilactibacillus sp. S3-3]|nr:glycosyltransferase family 4 protein [Terrilactibacillus sp. S3-3]